MSPCVYILHHITCMCIMYIPTTYDILQYRSCKIRWYVLPLPKSWLFPLCSLALAQVVATVCQGHPFLQPRVVVEPRPVRPVPVEVLCSWHWKQDLGALQGPHGYHWHGTFGSRSPPWTAEMTPRKKKESEYHIHTYTYMYIYIYTYIHICIYIVFKVRPFRQKKGQMGTDFFFGDLFSWCLL